MLGFISSNSILDILLSQAFEMLTIDILHVYQTFSNSRLVSINAYMYVHLNLVEPKVMIIVIIIIIIKDTLFDILQ